MVRAVRRALEALGPDRLSKSANWGRDDRLADFVGEGPGTFVEVEAGDGHTQSITYFLERRRGWRGVLVEPIPELYRLCRKERTQSQVFICALVASDFPGSQVRMLYGDLSLAAGTRGSEAPDEPHRGSDGAGRHVVYVPARTLSSVLDEAGVETVDLLVVDVKGRAEADVLRGLDLDRFRPRCVLVESLDDADEQVVAGILGDAYGRGLRLSPDDVIYTRRTHSNAPRRLH